MESTSTFMYSGSLLLLATGMTTTTGMLPLHFTLPDGYAANENTSCFVDLIFTGRNASAGVGQGYSFTQHLPVQFFVPANVPQSAFSPPVETLPIPIVTEEGTASTTPEQSFVPPSEPAPESDAASSSEEVLPPTIPTDDISATSSEVVLPEEIRGKIPGDYGRSRGVAWYYLGGFAIVHPDAANARIIMWDSAA